MAIDTDALASIGGNLSFDPAGAQGKALSIKDMMDREQLSKLQVGQAKQDAATNTKVQELLKGEGVDYSNPEGVMRTAEKINKISPKAALEFQTQAQKYSSGKVQNQVDQYELLDHQQGVIVSTIDPIVAQAREMKNKGADDMTVNAFIQQQLPGAIQNLQNTKLPNGQSALSPDVIKQINESTQKGPMTLATLEGFEQKSKAGQQAIRGRLEQLKADTAQAGQRTKEAAETEKERHDLATEAASKAKIAGFSDTESDLLAALADKNVSLPAGLRSQTQIKSTIDGLLRKHPEMSADEIAEGIKSGKLKLAAETKGAQTAGTQIGKVALAANELDTFGDQTVEASAAVPRGNFVPYNQLRQTADSKISDPALLRFKAKMQALENAYNQLAARSGTDVDKRAHIHELFNAANSDEAVQTLVKSLKEEAVGARDAADRTIAETSGSAIPGAGPAAPAAAPGPAAPAARPGQGTSGPAAPANAPRAVGPNGHEIVYNGQAWVDAQTGKPVG
jgi:hypothetical protein